MLKTSIFPRFQVWLRASRYLARKALTIVLTIFVGVFLTLLIANQPTPGGFAPGRSPFEVALEEQIDLFIRVSISNGTIDRDPNGAANIEQIETLTQQLRQDAGLE